MGKGDEGRYLPNGTWVHAQDPAETTADLMSLGCSQPPGGVPRPSAVLAGTLRSRTGRPGTVLALQFSTTGKARTFRWAYLTVVRSCTGVPDAPFTVRELAQRPDVVSRRTFSGEPGTWLELVARRDKRLLLAVLSEGKQPTPTATAVRWVTAID